MPSLQPRAHEIAEAEQVRLDVAALRAPEPLVADELAARVTHSQALAELGELAAHAEEPGALLRAAVHLVARSLDAERVAVLEPGDAATLRVRASNRRELIGVVVPASGTLASHALDVALATAHAASGERCAVAAGARCGAALTINGGGRRLAVLCVCARDDRAYDPADVQFLQIAGNIVGGFLGRHAALVSVHAMQARLALADRILASATVAAGLAHEINNPLAVVTSNLAWLEEALDHALAPSRTPALAPTHAELREALSDARRGAERIRDLVRDLRALNRVDEHDLAAVPLGPLVTACARIASAELAGRARLVLDVEGAPPVHGNEARLGQVFLNLLVNAAHAIAAGRPESNEVRVHARRDGDLVAIEVRDTGRGIAPEQLPRLFEPFFASGAPDGPGRGRGLGLPICHQIVSSIGGSIEVESTRGVGSTFRVRLRVAPGDAPPAHVGRPAP